MKKHLLISKDYKGWGGTLTIALGQGKKTAYITGRTRLPVMNHLSEPTDWPFIDIPKNGGSSAGEIGLMIVDCGDMLRRGLYPR